jgi:hypothetical protein
LKKIKIKIKYCNIDKDRERDSRPFSLTKLLNATLVWCIATGNNNISVLDVFLAASWTHTYSQPPKPLVKIP